MSFADDVGRSGHCADRVSLSGDFAFGGGWGASMPSGFGGGPVVGIELLGRNRFRSGSGSDRARGQTTVTLTSSLSG
jgi:hypothetical protein